MYPFRHFTPLWMYVQSGIIGAFVVLLLSHVCLLVTPWTAARQASLSFTISRSLLKLMSIVSVMPSNHLILCHPLFLPSIFPSISVSSQYQGLFFSFSISPSNEYSRLISFRNDWFDLLVVQGALKSLLQHHNWMLYRILSNSIFGFFKEAPFCSKPSWLVWGDISL